MPDWVLFPIGAFGGYFAAMGLWSLLAWATKKVRSRNK